MILPVYIAGEGEPLLMIHGIISDGSFFRDTAERLKDAYRVISYDRRGYGADSYGGEDYSVAAQAEDAADILRAYAMEPAWVVGNSAGGLIAMELCQRHPELVRGMILLEPSLSFDEESKTLIRAWNEELNSYVAQKKTKRALAAFARVTGKSAAQQTGTSLAEMKTVYKNLENFLHGELNEVQHYFPDLQQVKDIAVPVKIFITEQGKDTLFGITSRNGADALGWQVVSIPGYHNALKEEPDSSAEAIRQVLKEMHYAEKTK